MDHGPETDRLHDLLTAVGTGDRRAFDALYLRLSGRLHAVALRMLRDADLAEDAVHDAFVQIWRNAGRYDRARGEVTAWAIGILRYRALDLLRRRGRETTADPVIVADLADQAAAADPDNPPPSRHRNCPAGSTGWTPAWRRCPTGRAAASALPMSTG